MVNRSNIAADAVLAYRGHLADGIRADIAHALAACHAARLHGCTLDEARAALDTLPPVLAPSDDGAYVLRLADGTAADRFEFASVTDATDFARVSGFVLERAKVHTFRAHT